MCMKRQIAGLLRIWDVLKGSLNIPQKPLNIQRLLYFQYNGGDEEDRTLDLTDANRTLSQLSYAPELFTEVSSEQKIL